MKKGFTLIEVVVAIGVLTIAVVGLLTAFTDITLLAQQNFNRTMAINDAQSVLEQIKSLPFSAINSYMDSSWSNCANELIDVDVTKTGQIAEVRVDVGYEERGARWTVSLPTRIVQQ